MTLAVLVAACSSAKPVTGSEEDCPPTIAAPESTQPAPCPPPAGKVHDVEAIRQSLDRMSAHGLDPGTYASGDVETSWRLAATHLRFGALDPATLTPRLQADASLAAYPGNLDPAYGAVDYRGALDALAPTTPMYWSLVAELKTQRAALAGLKDAAGIAAAEARIASLRAGLERLRWLAHDAPPRQIMANIPTFEVMAFENGSETSRRAAVFGQLTRQTPEFSDAVEYVVFNPWWDVPDSIARRDKLAQFRRDPGAVSRLGYRIVDRSGNAVSPSSIDWQAVSSSAFPYHIRQAPGPANALGQVKFVFPNPDAVYLHDTPEKNLFARQVRTFSSGCIRVQDPVGLASWVLKDTPGWDDDRIAAAVASGDETKATLAAPVPIDIVYLTAIPSADGTVVYAPDIYGRDASLLEALASPMRPPAQAPALRAKATTPGPETCAETG
ncbi:MAG: L,D-transpeptidase family protein [Acidobacteria bacterium]|nr:L,D-transpeptidase family protein [Acidobacteriota bacterium]